MEPNHHRDNPDDGRITRPKQGTPFPETNHGRPSETLPHASEGRDRRRREILPVPSQCPTTVWVQSTPECPVHRDIVLAWDATRTNPSSQPVWDCRVLPKAVPLKERVSCPPSPCVGSMLGRERGPGVLLHRTRTRHHDRSSAPRTHPRFPATPVALPCDTRSPDARHRIPGDPIPRLVCARPGQERPRAFPSPEPTGDVDDIASGHPTLAV